MTMPPTTDLYVIGCSGHGREVAVVARAVIAAGSDLRFAGYVDDNPTGANLRLVQCEGVDYIGGVEDLLKRAPASFVVGIGDGSIRHLLDERLVASGWQAATLVHPFSAIGPDVELAAGTVICAGVTATTNIRIGRHVHINRNATIGHDSRLMPYVTVNPMASISGGVHVERAATIGAAATILQYRRVGAGSVVGAGAVVVHDVSDGVTVKGVPAK